MNVKYLLLAIEQVAEGLRPISDRPTKIALAPSGTKHYCNVEASYQCRKI